MITLRRAADRQHDQRRASEIWRTFPEPARSNLIDSGFGDLEGLNESRLGPGARVPSHFRHCAELITYVREGTVACGDSAGGACRIHAGEFQQKVVAGRLHHPGANASPTDTARLFQIWLHASGAVRSAQAQKRFSSAQRRGVLCVVASPDGRKGSLCIQQDVLLHSALLDPGQHIVYELLPHRRAWLHIVDGAATLGDLILGAGDGAGVTTDRAVSLTALEASEILLLDLR